MKLSEQLLNEAERICDGISDVDTTVNKLRRWAVDARVLEETERALGDFHATVGGILRKMGALGRTHD